MIQENIFYTRIINT